MNSRIQAVMFTTPVTVFPTGNKDSAGDRVAEDSFETFGYVYDDTVVVTNDLGEKEVSTRQIYLPLNVVSSIKTSYVVSCLDSVKAKIIKRQEYRGRRSRTLIGVLYLP
jgi:hypothetical protein